MTSNLQVFIHTLDDETVKKLAIRSLRRGIGSMDYIHTLLISEDDLNDQVEEISLKLKYFPASFYSGILLTNKTTIHKE